MKDAEIILVQIHVFVNDLMIVISFHPIFIKFKFTNPHQ